MRGSRKLTARDVPTPIKVARRPGSCTAFQVPSSEDMLAWGALAIWLSMSAATWEVGDGAQSVQFHTTAGRESAETGDWLIKTEHGLIEICGQDRFDLYYTITG